MELVQTDRQPHHTGPRVADQIQGNWLGVTSRGCIDMTNRRGEFTSPTMLELPVDSATPLVMAVNTGQPVNSQWETSMKLDEEPEDTHGFPPSGFLNPLALPEFLLHLRGLSLLCTIPRTIRQIYLIESCNA